MGMTAIIQRKLGFHSDGIEEKKEVFLEQKHVILISILNIEKLLLFFFFYVRISEFDPTCFPLSINSKSSYG